MSELDSAIRDAIGAHGTWKLKLKTAIACGRSDVDPKVAERDDQCAFGKWLHGAGIPSAVKGSPRYADVRRLHADFHRNAGQVLRLVEAKRAGEATKLLDTSYTAASAKLVQALSDWRVEAARH